MGQDAATTAMNSYGSAAREQEKYNQSLEARINRMKTAWYELADTAGQTIIYDILVTGTESLQFVTGKMADASSSAEALGKSAGILGTALLLCSTRFRTWGASVVASTGQAVASRYALTALSSSFGAVGASAAGAAVGVRAFMAATGVGLAITAVVGGLTLLISKWSESIRKQEEFDAYMQKNVDALTVNKEKVDELLNSYKGLISAKENGKLSTEQEEKLIEVQNQLAELYPSMVNHIDAQGNAHLKSVGSINQVTEATLKLIQAEKELKRETAEDTFKEFNKELDKLQKNRKGLNATLELKVDRGANSKEIAKIEHDIAKLDLEIANKSSEMSNSILEVADAFTDAGAQINDSITNDIRDALTGLDFSQLDNTELKEFSQEVANIRLALNDALASGDESGWNKAREDLNNLINSVGVSKDEINSQTLSFEKLNKSATDASKGIEVADESVQDIGDSAESSAAELEKFAEAINKLDTVQEQLVGVSEKHVEESEKLLYMYEMLTSRLQGLNDEELKALARKPNLTAEERLIVEAMKKREGFIAH